MSRRVGFSDEKSMPLAHVTLAPILGLNNHDEGASTDPAHVHRPARSRGHTASLPPCWMPVVPTSGKVSPLSSQEMQTILASLFSQRLVFIPEPITSRVFISLQCVQAQEFTY